MKILATHILLFILAAHCGCQRVSENSETIASVGELNLSAEELDEVIPRNISSEDSVAFADKFIQDWLREQVIFLYAYNNLPEVEMDFEEELENYRRSLVTFAFENHMVAQYLDTLVGEDEIFNYYEENKLHFQLKDHIVQVKFCILDSSVVIDQNFEKLFESDEDEDIVLFEQFCVDNGASYFIDNEKWIYLNDLLNSVPLEIGRVTDFLKKDKSLSFYAFQKQYFLIITDFKFKDSVSPLSLQRDKILNVILNRRKLDLLSKMRGDLYQEAISKNQIHIYSE